MHYTALPMRPHVTESIFKHQGINMELLSVIKTGIEGPIPLLMEYIIFLP